MDSLQTQVLETKNILNDNRKETLSFKSQLRNMNTDLTENMISCHRVYKNYMVKLEDEVKEMQSEISTYVEKSLINKEREEMTKLTTRVMVAEKWIDGIKDVAANVKNMENVLFCYEPHMNRNIKFKWVLQDYQHYFDIGEGVYSPKFYTHNLPHKL